MKRTLLRSAAALVVFAGSTALTPKADANWFGLFHTTHQASYQPPSACCGPAPVVRTYVAPQPVVAAASPCSTCAAPAPIAVPETCMQTRCYQVPVTRYETRTNYQLVTTNQVSEVMEPVTTLQTSAYFDPCNCGYHNVTTPVTTMVRKQVVTPIQRYVAQNYTVPVTTYVQQCEQVPVTQMRMYVPAPPAAVAVPAPAPAVAMAQVPTTGPALQAVPAAPGSAPPPGNRETINMPNPTDSMKQVPKDGAAGGDRIGYQNPPNVSPNRREEIERIFKNDQLVEERRRFVEPTTEPAPSSTGSGAPVTPRLQQPPTTGSSYAIPQEQKPMPKGAKTASWNPSYTGSVTLSKPYSL